MSSQGQSHGAGRYLFGIGLAMLAMLMLGLIQPVSAQRDYGSCEAYASPEAAQAVLDQSSDPIIAAILDGDGNGIACDQPTTGGPAVVDPTSCGHFESQADAQAALDARPELATTLDSDGNGIACEQAGTGGPDESIIPLCSDFETQEEAQEALDAAPESAESLDPDGNGIACEELQTGGPVVVDPASCGHFESQEDAQVALDARPELATSLDADGDGIACEDAFDAGESEEGTDKPGEEPVASPVTPGGDGNSDSDEDTDAAEDSESGEVTGLPATGTGPSAEGVEQGPLLVVLGMLTMMAIGLSLCRQRPLDEV